MSHRHFLQIALVGIALCSCLTALAEEPKSAALMQTLPVDGAWVTFDVTVKVGDQEFTMTGTARSVGQVQHNGKPCRFIEYEQTVAAPPAIDIPQLGNLTWRLLVPEEEFGEGKDPLSKASQLWIKIDTMDPEPVAPIEQTDPIFAILFQGPKKNLKVEDTKEKINWQRGDLECTVVSGQSGLELGVVKLDTTHRVFRHPDVPFGVAGMHQEMHVSLGSGEEKVTIHVTLRDHGKDAKAKLPELVP